MTAFRVRLAAGVALLCAGVLVLLLALDVGTWRGTMRDGDLRFAAAPYGPDPWRADHVLPFGVARRLVGVGDDMLFRESLRSFRLSSPRLASFGTRMLITRSDAQHRLIHATRSDGDRARRAREANLLGVLYLVAAQSGSQLDERAGFLLSAVANFAASARLDPANDDAKYNLELALQRVQDVEVAGHGGGGSRGRLGHGAGLGKSGRGY